MSDNIEAIDWFTKKRINDVTYPEQSDALLDKLIDKIIQVFNNSTRMRSLANGIYDAIENDPFLGEISSDSRLPVCSLFHHMKNTSGIAVCLAFQKMDGVPNYIPTCIGEYEVTSEYKEPDFISLIRIASLLHDIGKPRSYTSDSKYQRYHYHTRQTREIIEKILSGSTSPLIETMELENILPQLASKHHSRIASTKLEKLISNADTIASAADRIYEVKGKFNESSIAIECNDNIFPHEINFDAGDLKCSETPHTVIFGRAEEQTRSVELKSGIDQNVKSAQLFIDSTVHGGPVQYLSKNTYHLSGSIGILSLDVMGIQGFINEADKLKMLRGGSAIVDDALKCAKDIISKEVCTEAILFAGGGNLLSFVPNTRSRMDSISEKIKVEIKEISKTGLSSAIVAFEVPLDEMRGKFDNVLKESQEQLKIKKNETREKQIVPNTRTVCGFCFKREKPESSNMCKVCKIKEDIGKKETSKKYIPYIRGLQTPTELTHIGNSIAAIVIDGNMMGRMFQQTTTPAEYTYKSHRFSSKFDSIIKSTIQNFIDDPNNRQLITNRVEDEDYLGIDVLYAGGDDVLIIMNAKGALQFTEMLTNNVANKFTFETKFHNGTVFKNPTVTISCGIAIADSKFPIHFLLNAARDMESRAKEQFRKNTETDEFNIIKIQNGAIAVTAISSAMPSSEYSTFVLRNDGGVDNKNLLQLNNMINFALNKDKDKDKNRNLISDIITCGTSEHERLNLIKYMYSSIQRKTSDIGLDECEWMADVLLNDNVLKASKMIIPHLWHDNEEVKA